MTTMKNIKVLIYFNYEISHSDVICNFDIKCNNFRKTIPDDGHIQPKHVVRKNGD
jgi:hypothetical protein